MFRRFFELLVLVSLISSCGGSATTVNGNATGGDGVSSDLRSTIEVAPSVTAVSASRAFSGPTQFPPNGFAGYAILAFPSHPDQYPERFQLFCKAFLGSFLPSEQLVDSGIPLASQMVTVLPVSTNEIALALESRRTDVACKNAQERYGLFAAQDAIKKAEVAAARTDGVEELSGRGPFLLAWSPGKTFGSEEALVLTADLSNSVSAEQIQSDMQRWRRDIEQNPNQWRKGWNSEGIRLLAQRWVDRRGAAIIKLIGDWS